MTLVYDIAKYIFDASLVQDVSKFMNNVYTALTDILNAEFVQTIVNAMAGVAVSFLLVYFLISMVAEASKSMFTLEKFVVMFIKLFLGVVILLYLPDLISGMVNVGKAMFEWLGNKDSSLHSTITANKSNNIKFYYAGEIHNKLPAKNSDFVKDKWNFGLLSILDNLGVIFVAAITWLLSFVTKIAVYFVVVSTAIQILVKAVFSPIAIVQVFDDGTKSQGIKYLRGFLGDCCQMAVIVGVMYMSSMLTSYLTKGLYESSGLVNKDVIDLNKFKDSITMSNLHYFVIPQLATVGSVMGSSKLVHEIF